LWEFCLSFYHDLANPIKRSRPLTLDVQLQLYSIKKYKDYIAAIIREHGPREFTCRTGLCYPLSQRLTKELNLVPQFNAKRVISEGETIIQLGDVGVPNFIFHYFISDTSIGENFEIIIDSTYLQFLKDPHYLDLPLVFVGTREDLIALFEKHKESLKPMHDIAWYKFRRDYKKVLGVDRLIDHPSWDTREFVETNWSFGPGSALRKDGTPPKGVDPLR